MAKFEFADPGKFALVAINNVATNISSNEDYAYTLSDGTWVFNRIPVTSGPHWKKWLGSLRLESLHQANLILMYSEPSTTPELFSEHEERLKKRLFQVFCLLQLSGVMMEYAGAELVCGFCLQGQSEVRHMSKLPYFHQTLDSISVPVDIARLEEAVQRRAPLDTIYSSPQDFTRLRWGWEVLINGLQQKYPQERIHQFVRSLEALILPESGNTRRQFVHRCQTFAKPNQDTRAILEEAFDLRSMAEHLNDWEQALESHPEMEREALAFCRTRQMEQLALYAYSHIFDIDAVRGHFKGNVKQKQFWKLPDHERSNIWRKQIDLTRIC